MKIETKQMPFLLDDASEDGTIVGYGSLFGIVDRGGDRVEAGAFKKSLGGLDGPLPILWNHRADQLPIGKWIEVAEDEKGLRLKGKLTLANARAREVHAALKDKTVKGLSIGYRTVEAEKDGDVRSLKELELWEVSIVTFPMLIEAQVDGVKHAESVSLEELLSLSDREIEQILMKRDARRVSRSAAIAIMRDGLPAIRAKRDAGGDDAASEALNRVLHEIRAIKGG